MARLPRVLFCDRVAHCFVHAADEVWFDEKDFQIFREVLKRLVEKHKITILYFSLLSTHFHAILKFSENVSCGKLMGIIDGGLSKAYNKARGRRGHTWRSRYSDVTVEEESHFFAAFLYVAMNKRKAGMVDAFEDDVWSSYPVYAFGQHDGITTPAEEYLELGASPKERQAEFRDMLNESWDRFLDAKTWDDLDTDREVLIAGGRVDLKKMLAISDHIDEIQRKCRGRQGLPEGKQAQKDVVPEETCEAQEQVRVRMNEDKQEIVLRLAGMGAASHILNYFRASDEFILGFVDAHRRHFGLIPSG